MTTVRLDTPTEAILRRLASRRGQTKSDVIRDAIARLATEEEELSAYDRLRPFIGAVDTGGLQLSRDTGRRLKDLLAEKQRARGPG